MLKKIFNPKKKSQEPKGRHNTSKITLDPSSAAILLRHFSPLPSRAKSPSDVLDIVGYPLTSNTKKSYYTQPIFSQSSPELSIPTITQEQKKPYRLTIRNNISPVSSPSLSPIVKSNNDDLLLETSREEKTLVEKELDSKNLEIYNLHKRLLEFEQERKVMNQKFQDFIEREEQMRKIIEESQIEIIQLKHNLNRHNSTSSSKLTVSRNNSNRTMSSTQSVIYDEPEEFTNEQEQYNYYYYPYYAYYQQPSYQQQLVQLRYNNNKRSPSTYHNRYSYNNNYNQPYYYL